MNHVLDSMVATIAPEMPRQIQRWGGSMAEWEANVQTLRNFINARCTLLDDGAINCYSELNGPYQLTLRTVPDGIGEIDLNTLDIETFPWSGDYFGGMENKIKARVFDEFEEDYEFSHWESTSGNLITPSTMDRKAFISLTQADTLTAVFKSTNTTSIDQIDREQSIQVFPNPANEQLTVAFELTDSKEVEMELYSITGQKVADFPEAAGRKFAGQHSINLSLNGRGISSGLYLLHVKMDGAQRTFKVNIVQ